MFSFLISGSNHTCLRVSILWFIPMLSAWGVLPTSSGEWHPTTPCDFSCFPYRNGLHCVQGWRTMVKNLEGQTPSTTESRGHIQCLISVQFSRSVMSESLRSHVIQQDRLLCPPPTPRACSNSCPSSWWCHPTISSSAIPFSSCPQSFPASGSFQISQLFAPGGSSIGVSASVPSMNTQNWFPLGWTGWISLQSKGLSRVFSNTTVQKHQFSSAQLSLWSNSHIYAWLLEKPQPWLDGPLSAKCCLCFFFSCFLICCLGWG